MTINGTNISTYGASQHHVEFGYHEISNDSAWIRSAILPHMGRNYIGFKTISVDVMVKPLQAQSAMHPRDAIHANISNLLASLLAPVDLVLDNHSHTFHVVLKSHKLNEVVPRRFQKLTLDFDGYEYGSQVEYTGTGSVVVSNPGNLISPLKLEITPAANTSSMTITGICPDPVTGEDTTVSLATAYANKVITLDGANGLFTEDGVLKPGITIAGPPGVKPGTTTITCNKSGAALKATILPLYM